MWIFINSFFEGCKRPNCAETQNQQLKKKRKKKKTQCKAINNVNAEYHNSQFPFWKKQDKSVIRMKSN